MFIYSIGVFFFLFVWLCMYLLVPKSRKAILWSSIVWGPAGPISEFWHLKDYWNPVYMFRIEVGEWVFGMEDYVFAFAYAGLSVGMFDMMIRKWGERELVKFYLRDLMNLSLIGVCCLLAMGALVMLCRMNSLHAITIVFLFGAAILIAVRPKWALPAILTAVVAGILMWIFYWGYFMRLFPHIIQDWWSQEALSGHTFGGVPIEEIIWASSASLFVGPAYRYCTRKKR